MASKSKVAILIGSAFDAKGFKQADTATAKLAKGFKTLGLALSVGAVTKFGKDAAQAFIQDQKEASRLTQVIKNLGLELSSPRINRYIESLSEASGVTDSQLRPAFQALISTTGSVTASQKALQDAIDISVGSGIELTTVSQDLANAYVGNTKGLKKYNLGLTQAELKTASFTEISAALNKQYSGANSAYLDTYAGKLQMLGTAAGEAQEKLGGAIIDLAMAVTGASDVEELIKNINTATDFAVARLDNFIEGWKILKAIVSNIGGDIGKSIQNVQVEEFNRRMKRDYMKAWEGIELPLSEKEKAQRAAAEAAAKKRAAELAKLTKKNTDELKKQNLAKRAGTLFDMTQIQIIAALKGQISKEERDRLELQLALVTGNADEVVRLTGEVGRAQGLTEKLISYLQTLPDADNPFKAWKGYLDDIELQAKRIAELKLQAGIVGETVNTNISAYIPSGASPITYASSGIGTTTAEQAAQLYGGMGSSQPPVYVNVQIAGEDVNAIVTGGLQNQSLSGQQAFINRIYGQFGG